MATIYVSKTGNDGTGDGSVGYPYLTVAHALSVASSTDVVSVGDGTYEENQLVVPTGVSIISTSQDKTAVTITPAYTDTSNPFITIHSSTPGTSGNQSITYLTIDGRNGVSYYFTHGIRVLNVDDVEIGYNNIVNFYGSQADTTASGIGGGSYGIHATSDSAFTHAKSDAWLFVDSSLNQVDWPSTLLSGLNVHHNYIEACGDGTVDRDMSPAIYIWALYDFNIDYNTIDTSGQRTQAFYSTSALLDTGSISYNDIISHPDGYFPGSGPWHSLYAIELWVLFDVDFIGNRIVDGGISTTLGKNVLWEKNYVDRSGSVAPVGYSLEALGVDNAVVRFNFFRGNGSASNHSAVHVGSDLNTDYRAYSFTSYFYGNIVIDHYYHGITSSATAHPSPAQTITSYIIGNLIDGNGIYGGGYSGIDIDASAGHTISYTVSGNIVTNQNGTGVRKAGTWTGSVTADHCCIEENGTDVSNVSETNSITTEPTYTDYSGKDFTLVEGSSAIDAGDDVGSPYDIGLDPSTDWEGGSNGSGGTIPSVVTANRDDYTPWDIGPYIYTGEVGGGGGLVGNGVMIGGGDGVAVGRP